MTRGAGCPPEVLALLKRLQDVDSDSMTVVNLISADVRLENMLVAKGILFQIKIDFQSELDLMSSLVNLYASVWIWRLLKKSSDAIH